jgi:hypothetical protein
MKLKQEHLKINQEINAKNMEFDVPEINVGIVQDYGEKDLTGSSYEW